MPFVVALTGGIGSGKSLVSDAFAKLGATVIDTDQIARELTGIDGAAMPAIVKQFGNDVLLPDGTLDRNRLRDLVFRDSRKKLQLERILHPMIHAEAAKQIRDSVGPYVILVVPLLIETDTFWDVAARILVIDCDEQLRIERVMRRNGLSRDQVMAIMRAQASRQDRLALADDVISNDGTIDEILPQVSRLHEKYLQFACLQC